MTAGSKNTATVDMSAMALGPRHIRIMLIASLGQFIGQGLATLTGIVIPLIQLAAHPGLPAAVQGLMGCISLIGIMLGTVVFGRLSDRYGYLLFFRLCPLIILIASVAAIVWHEVPVILACLFVMGFAIGGEYSLDPDYISELMPARWRTFMVGLAKAIASAGSATVAIVCYVIITDTGNPAVWPDLFWITAAIAALMFLLRLGFAQSPQWLAARGRTAAAQQAVRRFLGPDVRMDTVSKVTHTPAGQSFGAFVRQNLRQIVLTGVPWACEGLGVYGIGIFLPVLIMRFRIGSLPSSAAPIDHITHSVALTFALCIVMMAGFLVGLLIMKRVNHLRLQIVGFWGSAAGLGLLLAAYTGQWPSWTAIAGFVVFELFLNAGPHLVTFILPSQIYPVDNRGTGTGLAAAIGKSGAVAGAFVIPVLLRDGGPVTVMIVSIAVMAAGALITMATAPRKKELKNSQL